MSPDPAQVAAARRYDLLLTLVMIGILLTPAWLTPSWFATPWKIAVLVLAGPMIYLTWRHGPWVPTPYDELPRIIDALGLSPGDRFCDLGAGDGRMVRWVREATGATCVGIEASPLMYLVAAWRLRGDPGATVRLGDLYRADLSEFDVVYVWGTAYSVGTARFHDLVQDSMRPGARLVSYQTPLPEVTPITVDEGGQRPIYTYRIGAADDLD